MNLILGLPCRAPFILATGRHQAIENMTVALEKEQKNEAECPQLLECQKSLQT